MSLLFPNTNASTCLLVLSLRPCIQHETFQGLVILRCLEEPKYPDIRIHRQSDKLQVLSSGALATIGLRLLQSLTILFLSFVLFGLVQLEVYSMEPPANARSSWNQLSQWRFMVTHRVAW